MKSRITWCLIGINIALLAMFVLPRLKANTAVAQSGLRPADYILIPGAVSGVERGVVYVIDSSNGQMSALSFNDATGKIDVMVPKDLQRIFEEGQDIGGVGGAAPKRRAR